MSRDSAARSGPPGASDLAAWFLRASDGVLFGGAILGGLAALRTLVEGPMGAVAVLSALYTGVFHFLAALLIAGIPRALLLRGGTAKVEAAQGQSIASEPAVSADISSEVAAEGDRASASRSPSPEPVLEEAGQKAVEKWRALIAASREVNDPNRVLELYEDSPEGLSDEARRGLDQELAGWFLGLVHHRLRSGLLQLDVVALVERVSETFGHTKEGASLRAALPTLRRGAGLCARCAKPYVGYSEACPECLGRPEPPPPQIPGLTMVADVDDLVDSEGSSHDERSWFLDEEDRRESNGRPNG